VGLAFGDRNRGPIMFSAFVVSFVAWILIFAALFSTSRDASIIQGVCWATSETTFPNGTVMHSYIGIKERVDVVESSITSYSWDDEHSCDQRSGQLAVYSKDYWSCEECRQTAQAAELWLITAAITQVFQMTTDLQRTTRYGDLNCQKGMGMITGVWGTYSTLKSLRVFMEACTQRSVEDYMQTRVRHLHINRTGLSGPVVVESKGGPGMVLLLLATILKLYDVLCHVIVPTPAAKQEPVTEEELCLVDYMARNSDAARCGRIELEELVVGSAPGEDCGQPDQSN